MKLREFLYIFGPLLTIAFLFVICPIIEISAGLPNSVIIVTCAWLGVGTLMALASSYLKSEEVREMNEVLGQVGTKLDKVKDLLERFNTTSDD